jgi:hypothetical protein
MVAALLALAGAGPAGAQEFWEKKPHTEWNKDQCKKLLRDSPWSRTFGIASVQQDQFGQPTSGEGRQTEQRINYYVQLRGALPVRQAVARAAMIENKYDKMSEEQKKVFDASIERYLNSHSPHIIVHVEYETDVAFFDRALAQYWQTSFPEGTMPAGVYLTTSKGKRVTPINWKYETGGGRAFEFYFPREVDGEALIGPDVKTFSVEFPNPRIRDLRDPRAFVEFKTEKMKYKGELIY